VGDEKVGDITVIWLDGTITSLVARSITKKKSTAVIDCDRSVTNSRKTGRMKQKPVACQVTREPECKISIELSSWIGGSIKTNYDFAYAMKRNKD
jgi:hypothetical protein